MISISSNTSALSAIRSLQSVNRDLDTTQNRISSGLKIASAKDGAAAWSAATTIRSEISSNKAIQDGLGYTKNAADTAAGAAEAIVDALTSMRSAVLGYSNTSNASEKAAYQAQISVAQSTITLALEASKTGDKDWLNQTTEIKANVGVQSDGTLLTLGYTPSADLDAVLKTDVIDATDVNKPLTTFLGTDIEDTGVVDPAEAKKVLDAIDDAIADATSVAAGLGAFSDAIKSQSDFLKKISDIKASALSSLVDADMEEESARLSALQVKQQLATQALSIANSSSQNVLRLFQ